MKTGCKYVHIRTRQMHKLFVLVEDYNLDNLEKAIFKSLYQFFAPIVCSSYYKVMTMSDSKYTLTIRKDDEWYDIKFTINPIGNQRGIFSE